MTLISQLVGGAEPGEITTRLWNNEKLIFLAEMEGRDVFFSFDPESGEVNTN
ncbi:hypothetical protein [Paenibacillus sp. FSL K6-2524]|uniref:hypothetical protein n=1 Tax=Paenibacillus sp. FSL K6-2524 TaxID=2954516 RepID=UPI0030F8BFA5